MNSELKSAIGLLIDAEVELDAWKDMRPDAAGNTTELLKRIRDFITVHDPNHFTTPQESPPPVSDPFNCTHSYIAHSTYWHRCRLCHMLKPINQ